MDAGLPEGVESKINIEIEKILKFGERKGTINNIDSLNWDCDYVLSLFYY